MKPREINKLLSDRVLDVCNMLFPNGKTSGNNFVIGNLSGDPGESLKIPLSGSHLGGFTDFAAKDQDKGDLIKLWQKSKGLSFKDSLKEIKDYLGIKDKESKYSIKKPIPVKINYNNEPIKTESIAGAWLTNTRWISKKTLDAYQVKQSGNTLIFPFFRDGEILMYKTRDLDYEFDKGSKKTPSNKDPYKILFGWQAIPDDCREVVICEGEIDAMTYFEQGFPALSVPFGGGGGNKQEWVENEYEELQRFDKIYLSMDMDSAGSEGVNEIIKRLGRENCWIVDLPYKDANECHKNQLFLDKYIKNAKTQDPDELKNSIEFADKVWILLNPHLQKLTGAVLPWIRTHQKFRFRDGELTVWQGFNDHGKSMLLGYVMNKLMLDGERTCIASMEMVAEQTLKRMYYQLLGAPRDVIVANFDKPKMFLNKNCWIFDKTGNVDISKILDIFRYARKRYGVKNFVVDSLLKCVKGEDDYNGQKALVGDLCDFAIEYGCHINLVTHTRKTATEEEQPSKLDIRGSGTISDLAFNVFTVWRNKKVENKIKKLQQIGEYISDDLLNAPNCFLNCDKQRNGNWEGSIPLWFDVITYQYHDQQDYKPINFLEGKI